MPRFDVTAVVAVRDAEEHIGRLCTALASYLRALRLSFELLLLDEGSNDNTLAVLAMLRSQVPEMEVIPGVARGRGLLRGVELSRGRLLLLLCAAEAEAALDSPGGRAALGLLLSRMRTGSDVAASPPYLLFRRALAPVFHSQLGCTTTIGRLAPAVLRRARRDRLRVAQLGGGLVQAAPFWRWLQAILSWRPTFRLRRMFGVPGAIAPVDHSS